MLLNRVVEYIGTGVFFYNHEWTCRRSIVHRF